MTIKSNWWIQAPEQSPVWLHPSEKPNERIYCVTGIPARPHGLCTQVTWDESTRKYHPEAPDQTLYLGALEWAWSPWHNRLDSYYLSFTNDHWLLFDHALFDGDEWYWEWYLFGVAPKIAADERAVGFWMLHDILKSDLDCWETDHFHIISGEGLLRVNDFDEIGNLVWQEVQDESEGSVMSEQDQIVTASTTVITCAGYASINYTYQKPKPLLTLNPMGNFYRGSHYHKVTQSFFDDLIENGSLPKAGDVFDLGDKNLKLTVISVTTNYEPSALSRDLMRIEEELKDKQYERAQVS